MRHRYIVRFSEDDWNDLTNIKKMTDTKYSDLIKQGCKNIIREKKDYLVKTRRMRETLSNMV